MLSKAARIITPLLFAATSLSVCLPQFAAAQSPYRIVARWHVGGVGSWDYLKVDPVNHHLYITHKTQVDVVDTATGSVIGAITGMKGVHGVALDPNGKDGYISDGISDTVVVFERKSLQIEQSIAVGMKPDAILYEPTTKTIWAFNGTSGTASVINAASRTVIATVVLPGKPEFAVADGAGTIYNNIEDKNSVARIDAATRKVTATWPLTSCEAPTGLALDVRGHMAFSVCDGKQMGVTDTSNGKTLQNVPIGDGPDAAAYDSAHQLAFASNADGTLTVIDTSVHPFRVVQTLATKPGARTMALDPENGRIYLVSADLGPAPATSSGGHSRPTPLPNSMMVLVVGRE
jgi:YVTN family beta-propeller protein